MTDVKRRIASVWAALSLVALALAPAALAAAKPTAVTGPNTPFPEGKVRLMGYVDPEGSKVTACKFVYGSEPGNYASEAPCENHPGDDVQALSVAGTGGQFKLSYPVEFNGTTGTGDLTEGSNLITNVTTSTGEFSIGELIRNEGDGPSGLPPVETRIRAISPETLEISRPAIATKLTTSLQSELVENTPDLPFDATAAELQSALEALPVIGSGDVSVSRTVALPDYRRHLITFGGSLADTHVNELKALNGTTPLSGEHPSLQIEALNPGGLAESQEVTSEIDGLTSGGTYHYRLVAENAEGKSESEDALFRATAEEPDGPCPNAGALGTSFLPECRAWEMVSPSDKNGGDVYSASESARIAGDGSAASFASPSPFGDTSGAGADSEYEAMRTPAGWQTHGIFPRLPAGLIVLDGSLKAPAYVGAFSADLNRGVLYTVGALDNSEPYTEEVQNLYLRSDLRSPGAGTYRLLTPCPLCAEKNAALHAINQSVKPSFMGASADLTHVVFESSINLVKPANSGSPKLYENEEGTLRLVGILPSGQAASTSKAWVASNLAVNPGNVSADGSKVFWTDGTSIYMRLNHETTVELNESELSPPEGNGSALIRDVTPDGSKVFFADSTSLTANAPEGGGTYVYDTTKPASDPHNLVFVGPGVPIGASADGDTVYLLAGERIYVSRGGELRRVGSVDEGGSLYFNIVNKVANLRVSSAGQLLFKDLVPPRGLAGQFPGYCPNASSKFCAQLYSYDPATEALTCVSCPLSAAEGAITELIHFYSVNATQITGGENHAISSDGDHVFFSTDAALVPDDTNGVTDAYSFNTATSRVSLLSSGTDRYPSYFMEATPDGSNALFATKGPLSGWDFDTNSDLYDARVDGGLPEPLPVPAACEGESCRQPTEPMPGREATSSESLVGPGNPKPKPRHRRKHHKKRRHHARHGGHK